MIQDAVRIAVRDRLKVLQALAARLEQLLDADGAPGMVIARLAVDADHAAAQLAEHCRRLETAPEKHP